MGLAQRAPDGSPGRSDVAERRWRVLLAITSSDVGGAESILREVALRLDRSEFDPTVCSLRPCGQTARDIAASGTPVLTLDMAEQPRVAELVVGAVRFARRIDTYAIDLVHSFLYRANVVARIGARLSRRRPIVVSGHHTLTPLGGRRATVGSWWTRGLSDKVVAVSDAVRHELVRAERVKMEHIEVIENGVDTQLYAPRDGRLARAALGIEADAIVVGAVGRLSREKAYHHLLESVALVRGRGWPLELVVVGDGPERHRLEADVRRLDLGGHVRFLGVRRDLPLLYAAMDIFALSSLEEAAPTVLLEAMACGRAVVATNVGGSREMVEHERCGLLVEPGAPGTFAAAVQRLVADPGLRTRYGVEARRRVVGHFDVTHMVDRHARLYRNLLRHRHRAARISPTGVIAPFRHESETAR